MRAHCPLTSASGDGKLPFSLAVCFGNVLLSVVVVVAIDMVVVVIVVVYTADSLIYYDSFEFYVRIAQQGIIWLLLLLLRFKCIDIDTLLGCASKPREIMLFSTSLLCCALSASVPLVLLV